MILERGGLKLCSHSVRLHKGTYSSGAMNPVDFFHHMPADKKYGSLAIWQKQHWMVRLCKRRNDDENASLDDDSGDETDSASESDAAASSDDDE